MKLPRLFFSGLLLAALGARAELTRVDVASRLDLGASGYEKIVGTAHFAVDPRHAANRLIVDLDQAPRNAEGRVEFSADLYILRPKDPQAGNGGAILEVSNRGGRGMLGNFNRGAVADPKDEAGLGDKFLLRQGFALVWVGWEFDVPRQPGQLRIEVPVATDGGKPLSGVVHSKFILDAVAPQFNVTDLTAYTPSDPAGPDTRLTVRNTAMDPAGVEIPRARWQLNDRTVILEGGFEAGKTYELFYRATNPPVAGLGFAALRDTAAWLKHGRDTLAPVSFVHGFGTSQSGRVLRDFLYQGFNADERDRPAFDGVIAHIAGSSRIDLNARWSLPRSQGTYGVTSFPFADAAQVDPVSGSREGLLENSRTRFAPKVFYTNTSVEYWGGGRVAALTHTNPAGTADLALSDNVRSYFFAGAQHGPSRFPPANATTGQQRQNPTDFWLIMRALLPAMHRWVRDGTPPPASMYPTLRDGTLVRADAVAFPALAGVASPRTLTAGVRVPNPLLTNAGAGAPLPLLVPQVDEDGNERAGIRLPDVAVPLATYTGWNFRRRAGGDPVDLVALAGAWIPFPATVAVPEATKDPRRSVAERYASRAAYLDKIREEAGKLVARGYLLEDDVATVTERAGAQWDFITAAPKP